MTKPINKDILIDLCIKQGKPATEVGELLGISHRTVSRYIHKYNIPNTEKYNFIELVRDVLGKTNIPLILNINFTNELIKKIKLWYKTSSRNSLDDREKDIIENYYGIMGNKKTEMTVLGQKHNVTKQRIYQLKNRALRKLRYHYVLRDLKYILGLFDKTKTS